MNFIEAVNAAMCGQRVEMRWADKPHWFAIAARLAYQAAPSEWLRAEYRLSPRRALVEEMADAALGRTIWPDIPCNPWAVDLRARRETAEAMIARMRILTLDSSAVAALEREFLEPR